MQVTCTEPQQKQQNINVIHGLDGVLYMTQQTHKVTRSIQFRVRIPSPMISSRSAKLAESAWWMLVARYPFVVRTYAWCWRPSNFDPIAWHVFFHKARFPGGHCWMLLYSYPITLYGKFHLKVPVKKYGQLTKLTGYSDGRQNNGYWTT